jgi:probable rRNA maturation factor
VVDEQEHDNERFPVDAARWSALARAVVDRDGASRAEVSVLFVDEPRMADLNEQFLGASGSTDVLAFPIDTDLDEPSRSLPTLLGDVVICPAVAARNAPDHAGTLDDEVALLLVHGLLHLLGLDHATDDERVAMQQRERELLAAHYGALARDPWS